MSLVRLLGLYFFKKEDLCLPLPFSTTAFDAHSVQYPKRKKLDFLSVLMETVHEPERSQARNMPDLSAVQLLGNQKNVIQITVESMFSMNFTRRLISSLQLLGRTILLEIS